MAAKAPYDGCEGTITYTWTYEDCAGNSHDWVYTYTIERLDFTLPADEASTVACEADATEPTPPTATDNCGDPITPSSPTTGGTYNGCEGTITYTWTYADCAGNSHDWVYTYTIEGLDFTLPADEGTTVACEVDATAPMPPTVNDNCGDPITPSGPTTGGTYDGCEGSITYTWTYADCAGNSHPWIYTYTIERLDFTLPADEASTVACEADATEPTPPTVNDNCGDPITPSGPTTGGTYNGCEGTITYTWTYADCAGNSHPWVYTYTIERLDFTLPADEASTVACEADATEPTPPTVNDDCGDEITPSGPMTGGTYDGCEGTITYSWTYEDCAGNSHPWVYTYTIERLDFTLPADDGTTVACEADATEPTPPTVNDDCGDEITPTGPVTDGTYDGCEGTITYTWTYEDCAGNSHDWVYTYTIDRLDFTLPADEASTVACEADATEPTPPTVNDNCGDPITPSGPTTGGTYNGCEGTITYTWTYADCAGNSHDWVYTYTIEGLDFTLPADEGTTVACEVDATAPMPPTVNDNCGDPITPSGPTTGGTYDGCEGTITYTWTYADCAGNSHDWVYTYTIERLDFTLPADEASTVACEADATEPTPPTVNDNCGDPITPSGPTTGGTYNGCEGTITYTWTYADCAGNSHEWVYTYTIERWISLYRLITTVACLEPAPPDCGDPMTGGTAEGTITYTVACELGLHLHHRAAGLCHRADPADGQRRLW
jgi:hypothetical protein